MREYADQVGKWAAGVGSSSSETSISTHGGVEWCHALRRLQAAISLGMQLQRPARPDLKARGMGLEGYSLYHAQPGPCQPAVALNDVGRTAIRCRFATKTGEGLIKHSRRGLIKPPQEESRNECGE